MKSRFAATFRATRPVFFILLLLLIALAAAAPGTARAAPAEQVVREDGILGITPGSLPRSGKVCTGSSVRLTFFVKNISPGVEVPIPVNEGMVSVQDDQGRVRELLTNPAGVDSFSWPVNKDGPVNLTVTARKQFYKDAQPFKFSLQAAACKYALKISFHEEYAILKDVSLVVGATTDWRGTLQTTEGQGEDAPSEISLLGGSGSFQFYVADQIQAPFHFSLYPPVSGDYTLDVHGKSDGNTVRLEFTTTPVTYPQIVTMKVTDYSNRGIQVNYMPPAPTSNGNGLFLELNKLSSVTFPSSGGVINLDSGMSCYFFTPDRTKYSLSIMLYTLQGDNAFIPSSGKISLARRLP
jgi:hypothetical protein